MIDPPIETVIGEVRTVEPSTPVREAAQYLRRPAVRVLVVRDGDGGVGGVVTASDVVALVAETDDLATVSQCMSSPVTTISPAATVAEAARRMRRDGVKHLPVVDEHGTCIGVVSRTTLAPYCSRRSLDVTWTDDPLNVDPSDPGGVPAHD